MTGEVVIVCAPDTRQPWVGVRIDGTHKHVVFSHVDDVRRTTSAPSAPGTTSARRDGDT